MYGSGAVAQEHAALLPRAAPLRRRLRRARRADEGRDDDRGLPQPGGARRALPARLGGRDGHAADDGGAPRGRVGELGDHEYEDVPGCEDAGVLSFGRLRADAADGSMSLMCFVAGQLLVAGDAAGAVATRAPLETPGGPGRGRHHGRDGVAGFWLHGGRRRAADARAHEQKAERRGQMPCRFSSSTRCADRRRSPSEASPTRFLIKFVVSCLSGARSTSATGRRQ